MKRQQANKSLASGHEPRGMGGICHAYSPLAILNERDTMTRKEYNGWTNYETWAVKLWMDNEEGSYRYWREQAEELVTEGKADKPHILADLLKEQHEEALPVVEGFAADLLGAAMSEVNWFEIAESLINDAKEVA